MTKFEIFSKDREIRISCKNHAKSDVCRGVSALIYALVNKLRFDAGHGLIENLDVRLESGDAEISFEYRESLNDSVMGALETVVLGMRAIKESYPEELEINFSLVGRN